MAHRPTKQT
ncbi:hypothetical protein MIMGU_mgv11b0146092mg, partial [Erythranthe guttata]